MKNFAIIKGQDIEEQATRGVGLYYAVKPSLGYIGAMALVDRTLTCIEAIQAWGVNYHVAAGVKVYKVGEEYHVQLTN